MNFMKHRAATVAVCGGFILAFGASNGYAANSQPAVSEGSQAPASSEPISNDQNQADGTAPNKNSLPNIQPPVAQTPPESAPSLDAEYCKENPEICETLDDTPDGGSDTSPSTEIADDTQSKLDDIRKAADDYANSSNKLPELMEEQIGEEAVMREFLEMIALQEWIAKNAGLSIDLGYSPYDPTGESFTDDELNGRSDARNNSSGSCANIKYGHAAFCIGGLLLGTNLVFGTHGAEGAVTGGPIGWWGEVFVTIGLLTECADILGEDPCSSDEGSSSSGDNSSSSGGSSEGGSGASEDNSDGSDNSSSSSANGSSGDE